MVNIRKKLGEAYAFFDCSASTAEITEVLPRIRADLPDDLELSVMATDELVRNPETQRGLLDYIRKTPLRLKRPEKRKNRKRIVDLTHVIRVRCPGSNEDAASHLPEVLTGVYYTFDYGTPFHRAIVGEILEGGVSRGYDIYEPD